MTYQPISCDFYDVLINFSVQKKVVAAILNDDNHPIVGLIVDVYTKDKEEFAVINEKHVRLDNIKSIKEYISKQNK
jgi:transcriptional antiterminator Rof (Rho-off)